jgi:hypothetical protein
MRRVSPAISLISIACLFLLACGGSSSLSSVSIAPSMADAQNFPGGKVQFTATGRFGMSSQNVPLTSKDVAWCVGGPNGICAGNTVVGSSVSTSGLAECLPGFSGTQTILAGRGTPSMNPDAGWQMQVYGSATLNCP